MNNSFILRKWNQKFFIPCIKKKKLGCDILKIPVNFFKLLTESNGIYLDSYYGSLLLAQELNKNKLKFVLCCKSDRPSVLFSKKLPCWLKKEKN